MSKKVYISLQEIFKYRLRKTYEEMLDLKLIENKLTRGSPRTLKIFERFIRRTHSDKQSKPKLQEKRNIWSEHRKFMSDYGFLRRLIEDGQVTHVD
jgi:hypothetical protein